MNIFIAGLNYNMSEAELGELFAEYGEVVSVKIIMDRETGRSKGYGFVEMADDEAGDKAIAALNEVDMDGKTLSVYSFLGELGFEVVVSDPSSREMYMQGQHSIPSDTVCYPAKLVHGHIENLIEKGVHSIFYPCMTYNLDEGRASNCYNCPVVAYYPELLEANVTEYAVLFAFTIRTTGIFSIQAISAQLPFIPSYPSNNPITPSVTATSAFSV